MPATGHTKFWIAIVLLIVGGIALDFWLSRQQPVAIPPLPSTEKKAKPSAPVATTDRSVPRATDKSSPPPVSLIDTSPPLPRRSSPHDSTFAEATFVGSDSCLKCHKDQCDAHQATNHYRSFRAVDVAMEPADGEFSDAASGRSYRVYRRGNEFRHAEFVRTPEGKEEVLADHAVRFAIGSGGFAQAYITDANGFFFGSPITWYSSQNAWKLAPGFEAQNSSFGHTVSLDCVFCHSGRVEAYNGSHSRFEIKSTAIDCERCHGPGSKHVQLRESSEPTIAEDLTIVHPGKISRELKEDVCAQCHSNAAAVAPMRGRTIDSFRAGMSLTDFRLEFAVKIGERPLSVVGHSEQLHVSPCYQGSEKLTCLTCHDPHSSIPATDRVAYFRQKCIECHAEESCKLTKPERLEKSKEDYCVQCHMPPGSARVPHIAYHNHRIGIHASSAPDAPPTGSISLVPLQPLADLPEVERDRALGLAHLHLVQQLGGQREADRLRQTGQQLLTKVIDKGLKDPDVYASLSQSYQRSNPQRSLEFAGQTLSFKSLPLEPRAKALFAASDSLIATGDLRSAVRGLQELVQLRRQANDWLLLAVCHLQLGNIPESLAAAQRAAEIRPDRPNHHALLAELYRRQNQTELAEKHAGLEKLLTKPKSK